MPPGDYWLTLTGLYSAWLLTQLTFVEDSEHIVLQGEPDFRHAQDVQERSQSAGDSGEDDAFCENVEMWDEDNQGSENFQNPDGEIESGGNRVQPFAASYFRICDT